MSVYYDRLSNLDASFLALESRSTHMHVGAVARFGPGPATDGVGVDIDLIRRIIESKLHLIPRYRQRLATIPLERHPVWVDDEHFHLDYHVRHVALPHPGTDDQLKALAGRLMSQQLDRSKPLWELNIVEGLADGGFAIITKIHHCMVDGVSGIDLMAVILDFSDQVAVGESEPWEPRPAPRGTELAVREISRAISSLVASVTDLGSVGADFGDRLATWTHRLKASMASLGSGWLTPAARTAINGPIGPGRSFEWLQLPLDDVKAIKNTHRATVNDVMLAVVAGAVRTFLLEETGSREIDLDGYDFRVMAPVSVRTRSERGTLGNKVAMWLITMPIAEPDPVERLRILAAETRELKETDQALGASTLVAASTGAPAVLVSMGTRLAARARPFNMTVTNVPGPQFPLYLAGSPMTATYPLVPLWESHGIGVAMFSLLGKVDIGLNTDRDLIPDPTRFADAIEASFKELLAAPARSEPEVAAAPSKANVKKSPPMGTR
ncbi:MAG: wax ester/triacylglycerol synthase family O-acyltransferase [Acidimicrobiia bacterium]|nr:wax ester/triacylglycerol synthase family O-acyltransferase [Acidimicrobiia bacterium]